MKHSPASDNSMHEKKCKITKICAKSGDSYTKRNGPFGMGSGSSDRVRCDEAVALICGEIDPLRVVL